MLWILSSHSGKGYEVRDHFDFLAKVYDRIFPPPGAAAWFKLLCGRKAQNVLDVGGGTGRVAQVLERFAKRVVVLDFSHEMLKQVSKKPGLFGVRGEAENLPFPDGAFDAVVVVDALHHFTDQNRVLGELARVVGPDGRVVIEEPDVRRNVVRIAWLLERLVGMKSHFLSPSEIARRLAARGFRVAVTVEGAFSARVFGEKVGRGPTRQSD